MSSIKGLPNLIFLQAIGEDRADGFIGRSELDEVELSGVSWHWEEVFNTDVKYVRLDAVLAAVEAEIDRQRNISHDIRPPFSIIASINKGIRERIKGAVEVDGES